MRPVHVLLAVAVAVAWGVNFVVIDVGLQHYPPLLFAALRFAFTAIPAVFFVRRPALSWHIIALVGLFLGVGYFGLLFLGMHLGMPAGLSSLVLQSQAVFTLVFAAVVLGERFGLRQALGTVLATVGVLVIAGGSGGAVPFGPLLLVLGGAASWAAANVCVRYAKAAASLDVLVWSSVVPPVPLAALSIVVEGKTAVLGALLNVQLAPLVALVYLVAVATLFGFGAWNWLLRHYPASSVAPYSLLVPVFGLLSAFVFLEEQPGRWEFAGSVIVFVGLVVVTWPSRQRVVTPLRKRGSRVRVSRFCRDAVRQDELREIQARDRRGL